MDKILAGMVSLECLVAIRVHCVAYICVANEQTIFNWNMNVPAQYRISLFLYYRYFRNRFHSPNRRSIYASIEIFMCLMKQSEKGSGWPKTNNTTPSLSLSPFLSLYSHCKMKQRNREWKWESEWGCDCGIGFKYEVRADIVNGRIMQSVLPAKP